MACLRAIRESGGREVEIVAVDDGSVDDSVMLAESYADEVIRTEIPRGPASARNRGARSASGEIIVFVDADVVVPRETFALLRRRFQAGENLTGVQGVYSIDCPHVNAASQYKNLYYHYSWMKRVKNLSLASAASFFLAIQKEAFMAVGGFDERIANPTVEDADLGHRLVTEGGRVFLDRELQVIHDRSYRLRELLAYDLRLASAKTKLQLRRLARGRARQMVQPYSGLAVSTARATEMKGWLGSLASIPLALLFGLMGWGVPAVLSIGVGIVLQIPFLRFVAMRKGMILACKLCGITLMDLVAIDAGIVWGSLSFLYGKRY
jgi:hypothetical protein